MTHPTPNRWKGFVLGLIGGAVGTVAMTGYWQAAAALAGKDPRSETRGGGPHELDSISVVGTHHTPDESSTAALGRLIYQRLAGTPPSSEETKTTLSYLVHYAYGSLQGGLYGALTGGRGARDVTEGLAYGTALWLLGDELAVSLLGLADGPGKYPAAQHLARWGAHLSYGLSSAAVTTLLREVLS